MNYIVDYAFVGAGLNYTMFDLLHTYRMYTGGGFFVVGKMQNASQLAVL